MRTLTKIIFPFLILPFLGIAQVSADSELYKQIAAIDQELFSTYNECDLEAHGKFISEDLEFYHDKGGLSTDKEQYMVAIKENICEKVRRTLTEGTFEVHEIKGFGAVALGKHSFHNLVEDSHSDPSTFIMIFKETENGWKVTRVISLH